MLIQIEILVMDMNDHKIMNIAQNEIDLILLRRLHVFPYDNMV